MATTTLKPDGDNNVHMGTAKAFIAFPKLPLEPHNSIWEFAANLPCNLDIWAPATGVITYSELDLNIESHNTYQFVTTQPPPGILLASKRSREIDLRYYKLCFGSTLMEEEHVFHLEYLHEFGEIIIPIEFAP